MMLRAMLLLGLAGGVKGQLLCDWGYDNLIMTASRENFDACNAAVDRLDAVLGTNFYCNTVKSMMTRHACRPAADAHALPPLGPHH